MDKMKKKIDSRMTAIFLAFIMAAAAFGFIVLHIIRFLYPHISTETLWDEFSILPALGFITFVATKTLIVQRTFHLYLTNINPTGKIFLEMKRRQFGILSWLSEPVSMLEYKTKSSQKDLFIRNVSWYGIRGIDRCEFLVHHAPDLPVKSRKKRDYYYSLHVPYSIIKDYYSIHMDLSCLSEKSKNVITRNSVVKSIYLDEIMS